MWIERSMRVLPGFSNAIVQCFDSQVERRDFVSEPQIVRQEINDWVETKTKDKIQDLVPPAAIDSSTRLVLVNAIYFKGEWMHPFTSETSSTFKDTFYPLVSERKAKVTDFMTQKGTFSYYEDSLMQILSLPYRDNELSMLIMLPKSRKGLLRLEQQISSGQQLIDLASKMTDRYVQVTIPKFKTTLRLDLKKTLKEMGMSHMFDKNADFSGITGDKRLVVSDALHKAFIEVNEKGTEAAAATAVVFSERAAFDLELPVIFKADHAFLFSIRHENTQTPLFFGSLVNV